MKFLWTTIHVTDLEKSVQFYSSFAGLKVMNRFKSAPDMEIAFMGNGDEGETLLELICNSEDQNVKYGTSVSIGFEVESIEAALDKVRAEGVPVFSGPVDVPGGVFFIAGDPDGFPVQLYQEK